MKEEEEEDVDGSETFAEEEGKFYKDANQPTSPSRLLKKFFENPEE